MTREELKEQIDELMQQYANEEIDGDTYISEPYFILEYITINAGIFISVTKQSFLSAPSHSARYGTVAAIPLIAYISIPYAIQSGRTSIIFALGLKSMTREAMIRG